MKTITPYKSNPDDKKRGDDLLAQIRAEREAREKDNEAYYQKRLKENPCGLPFRLYHGTDAKMLGLTADQRATVFSIFSGVIDALWPLYVPLVKQDINMPKLRELVDAMPPSEEKVRCERIAFDVCTANMYKGGSTLYQYGSFYLDISLSQACDYAKLAADGGELGRLAHSLILGANILGLETGDLGEEFARNAGVVLQIADIPADPVVFAFDHLKLEKLRSMQDGDVDWLYGRTQHFRYLGEVQLDADHAAHLADYDTLAELKKAIKPY